jgi:hypothetical protein
MVTADEGVAEGDGQSVRRISWDCARPDHVVDDRMKRERFTSNSERSGTFPLGSRVVKRLGYGAMRLSGLGIFRPPRDRTSVLWARRQQLLGALRTCAETRDRPDWCACIKGKPTQLKAAGSNSSQEGHGPWRTIERFSLPE